MRMRAEDLDHAAALALLDWQVAMGATEAIGEAPVDRLARPPAPQPALAPRPAPAVTASPPSPGSSRPDAGPELAVAEARALAAAAGSLPALAEAMAGYEHCELKRGARQLVFADGNPKARVMIVGEAPGREEDRLGRPFVGAAGHLLDLMLAAIALDRTSPDPERAVYITNVLPWRPPENRDPTPAEMAMLTPFLLRHIELAAPDLLVVMGNHAAQALLGRRGITRLRGNWTRAAGLPALPMLHPAYLLRQPHEKRRAWTDWLELRARLDQPVTP